MHIFDTALGTCGIDWDQTGLTGVALPRERALRFAPPLDRAAAPDWVLSAVDAITSLLDGEPADLTAIPLSTDGLEPFAARVYAQTRLIGPGETVTYGQIARALGEPGAARAVGAALGANRWPIVVPCHRVLAADGSLHGFSAPGGLTTKKRMLEIEGAPGFTQQALFA